MKKKQTRAAIMATRYEVPALQLMLYWEAVFRFQRCPCYLRHISNLTQASFNSRFLLKDYFSKKISFIPQQQTINHCCSALTGPVITRRVFEATSRRATCLSSLEALSPVSMASGDKRQAHMVIKGGKLRMLCDSKETLLWKYGIIVP